MGTKILAETEWNSETMTGLVWLEKQTGRGKVDPAKS